ncbi:MAG: protein kinase [Planctomycetota bacterium]|jgi:serine/threonine-protein kinase|nr:protein kinase [Planctomycetota bacterium]MDP6838416.1 protein kinase [Planctomycetota bacterium]MDP6956872.1 protein kinase [Planctomycetota bacterium]
MDTEAVKTGPGAPFPEIPGYTIEALIGRGATGVVYRAVQLAVSRPVAIKVLHADLVGTERAVERLKREARTAGRLSHPHIVSAIDLGRAEGHWWFAMELVEGRSLLELLEDGPLSEAEAIDLFLPLAGALAHAQEIGVTHRDIKPGNILVDKTGQPRLVDLGLAFAEDDPLLTRAGGTLGTPCYISPEQARDPAKADGQSDQWSLGATLFHSVCGRPPFAGGSVADILSGVLYAPVPDPRHLAPHISRGLALVIRKCLSRDPKRRYGSCNELARDLRRVRARRAPEIRRQDLEKARAAGRRWLPWALAGGSALIVGLLALWAPWAPPEQGNTLFSADTDELDHWPPLDDVVRRFDQPQELKAALAGLAGIYPSLPERHRDRWGREQVRLLGQLDQCLESLGKAVETSFAEALQGRDFAAAEHLLAAEYERRLLLATGFARPAELPPEAARQRAWQAGLEARLEAARTAAQNELSAGLGAWFSGHLLPRVEEHVRAGRWRTALTELSLEPGQWEVEIDQRGIDEEVLRQVYGGVSESLAHRRLELLRNWRQLDAQLAKLVSERGSQLETALRRRETGAAVELLEIDFDRARTAAGLAPEEEIVGVGTAFSALEKTSERLAALALEFRDQDAKAGFEALEERSASLWGERAYAELARQWSKHEADDWRVSMAAKMALRRAEAEHLSALLERARRGALAGTGDATGEANGIAELWLGGILYSGRFREPLAGKPLVFEYAGGQRRLALCADEGRPLAEAAVIVQLAERAPEELGERQKALVLALFYYREGDLAAARRILEATPTAAATDLGRDLELRLREALRSAEEERAERDAWARSQYLRLKRERLNWTGIGAGQAGELALIGRLLDESRDAFSRVELDELRAMRDARLQRADRERLESLAALLGPDSIESLPGDRVRLRFAFDRAQVGAWKPGTWAGDGLGWVGPARPASDGEFLRRTSPRLVFGGSLDLGGEELDVELTVEQLESSGPPDSLVVSVAGFHAVLLGARGTGPLCLVGSSSAEDVLARARNGEGQAFDGLRVGVTHRLRLLVHQANGWASVFVDGKEITRRSVLSSPTDRSGSASVSLRSWEPVRLLSATILGGF